jgi:hypothetical protein
MSDAMRLVPIGGAEWHCQSLPQMPDTCNSPSTESDHGEVLHRASTVEPRVQKALLDR